MKIVITGSHFTPAQAVIEELVKFSDMEIFYIGRSTTREGDRSSSIESSVLPRKGVKFISIITGRLQRSFTIYTIPSLLKIPIGIVQSFLIMMTLQPDVVLSFGGYVSVPVVISAWILSIPVIVHEQTLVLGLANTINSLFASKIAISFKQSIKKNSKTILTGNPLREDILHPKCKNLEIKRFIERAKWTKLSLILITGGNQGSHIINQAVMDGIRELTENFFIIHQTGDSKFDDFGKAEKIKLTLKNPEKYLVKKWIDGEDFGYILKNCDLAVGRAGINTLLECAYLNVPYLAVPLPYLYKNEQNVNAKYFEEYGLVNILPQSQLTGQNLIKEIKKITKNIKTLKIKAKNAKEIVIPDAAKRLTLETIILAGKK